MAEPKHVKQTVSDGHQRLEPSLPSETPSVEHVSTQPGGEEDRSAGQLRMHQVELAAQNEKPGSARALGADSQNKYQDLYNLAPVGYFTLDVRGRILEVNQTGASMLGDDRSSLVGKPFSDSVAGRSRQTFSVHRKAVFNSRNKQTCNIELLKSDGTSFEARLESVAAEEAKARTSRSLTIVSDVTGQRLADEALRESEAKYHLIFSKEKDAIVLTDAETFEFLDVNEAAEKLWGYTKSELLGMTALDVSAEPEETRTALMAAINAECFEGAVRRHKKKDGIPILVEITAGSFEWKGRKVVCSILRDRTEWLKAEEALKLEREQLLSVFDSINEVIVVTDCETHEVLFTNKFVKNLYGKELVGGRCYQEVHGRSRPCDHCKTKLVQGLPGGVYRWEYHNPTVNRYYLATDRIIKWTNGRDAKFHFGIDVTDRKRAEDARRESEERFRAIFESTTDCIWVKDRSLKYTHVNDTMCKLIGFPASKIIGLPAADVFSEERGQQCQALEGRVLGGESIDLERTRNVRGTLMAFHDTLVPLRDQAGDIIGLCCISRNITERKRASMQPAPGDYDYAAPAMRAALRQAHLAGATDGIVLLQGESGSGKDFLARWIHDHSKRSNGPFFSINCAAVSKELAESELFGHERGAFTGAVGMKKGLLELAEGGTILLNEIGDLALSLQAKLLTFLDTRSFMRVGGQKHVRVNARLIAATHRDLGSEVEEKRFLMPLFYRLSVLPIHVPPLRERLEDLPVLVEQIMTKLASELQLPAMPIIDAAAMMLLRDYDWPGNVRELRNVMERSLILWRGGPFSLHMPRPERTDKSKKWSYLVRYHEDKSLDEVVTEVETSLYEHVLRISQGNKKEAARRLGISRGALYRYLKKWRGKPMD